MDHPEHDKPAAVRRVELSEFREDMTDLLRQAKEGTSFLIVAQGEVMAELRPPSAPPPPQSLPRPRERLIGAMRGQIWMADDFDTWPESFLNVMEGDEE